MASPAHRHREQPAEEAAGLEANTPADGFFHLATGIFVALGILTAVRPRQRRELAPRWRVQLGMQRTGWGAFNIVGGVVDHQVLGTHHVRDDLGGPIGWDSPFLALGTLLVVGGQPLTRSGEKIAGEHNARRAARVAGR